MSSALETDNVVLRDRHSDARDVHFLKRVGPEQFAADLASDADDGRRIEHGGGDAGDHVRRTGAGRSHGHTNAAGSARISVGHVRGALFVANQYVMQLGFADCVVDGKNRAAGITENVLHAQTASSVSQRISAPVSFIAFSPLKPAQAPEEKFAGTAVIAPKEAEETSNAYLAMTPLAYLGFGACHEASRFCSSASVTSTLSVRLGMSNTIVSPS